MNICHPKYVIPVARAVIPKLSIVINRENFKYKELATASKAASIIAASPPKSKNARKIAASEKLIAKFEWGSIKLSLGAMTSVKKQRAINPQSTNFNSKFRIASVKEIPPNMVKAILNTVDIFSRFINEKNFKCGKTSRFYLTVFLLFEAFNVIWIATGNIELDVKSCRKNNST